MIGQLSKELGIMIDSGLCPACGAKDSFLNGPAGGLAVNIMCSACKVKYNILPGLGAQTI